MANYIKGTKIQENSISETKLDSSLQSWKETVTNHINNNDNPHNITKSSIGLDNVTNDAQVKRSELGVANGVATLDSTGKVPSGQLPSYVDDVIEGYLYNGVFYKDTSYTTSIVGESGKIYIDLPTNKTYRWTGSVYGVISETIALGEISSTAYRGDRGKIAYDHSQSAHAPSNAQANVIETIKVNGTALTPNSKAVDITIPTVGNGTITIKQSGTSKGTFTTNQNGNTTIELTDTNTTYTAGDGLSLSDTTFSNNGVRSIATGTTNGTISVNTNGNISNIGVYGLKSAAYTNSDAYAAASHTHSQYLTGITKSMVEGVLTGNITSHTHSYLPLSGGTITGGLGSYTPLVIKSSNFSEAWINFSDTVGDCFIGSLNGVPSLYMGNHSQTIIHSGNLNSYAPKLDGTGASGTWGISISGNAASATNVNGGYCSLDNLATDFNAVKYAENKIRPIYSITDISLGAPRSYVSGLSVVTKYTGWQLVAYGDEEIPNPYFRSINDNGTWKPWKQLAFLDDNVASATKLQNARTIWGQSFDGTGNVSGSLTDVGSITPTTDNSYDIGTSSNQFRWVYTQGLFAKAGSVLRLGANNTDHMRIITNGNVGIGIENPQYKLHVVGNGYFTENVITESDFSSRGNAIIDGRVGIGTSSPAYPLVVNGTIECTKLLQTSDIKYKTNIKQIEYEEALKIIENLNPVTWDWNENTVETGSSSGFVAQEAEEFIPNAISRDNENNLSLDYTQLHSYEIKVIQEQQKEIKDLKQRLEVLENLVLQLTNREI